MTRALLVASLLALTLPASAQDSQPARPAHPTKTATFPGRVVFTAMDAARKPHVYLADGASGKVHLLAEGSMCLGLSPKATVMVLWSRPSKELEFRATDDPKKVLRSFENTFAWPAFQDENTVFLPNYEPKDDPSVKFEITRLSLDSGERVSIASFGETSWDDVPLRLTPDGKKLSFFLRGKARGLHLLDVASGKSSALSGVTMLNWAPDSQHCSVWNKKEKAMTLCKVAGDKLQTVETFPQGAVLGAWVSKDAMVYAKADFQTRKSGLVYRDMKTKQELSCTDAFPIDEMSLLTPAAVLPDGSFVFCEGQRGQPTTLVHAKVEGKKLTKQTLVELGGGAGMIFGLGKKK